MINANLAAAVKEARLTNYVNDEKENTEDEKKDRVLLAQLVEAAKGQNRFLSISFIFFQSLLSTSFNIFRF